MLPLENKKILYIGVSTFNYEKEIKRGLEKLGAKVDYYDERPANNFLTKTLLRLKLHKLVQNKIKSHYNKIIDEIKNKSYDFVFIIKLETIDSKILNMIKTVQKEALFILYLWDSIKNLHRKEKLLPFFDRAFSFDRLDVNKYKEFTFLPLFYIPIYDNPSDDAEIKTKVDLCFIGTGHTDRYHIVKKLKDNANIKKHTFYSFLFLQSKLIFWLKKVFDPKMKEANISDFSFSTMDQAQVLGNILNANVIIDIENKNQTGLTMRTIEMLGCRKKMATTNKDIKNYDFYDRNNIYIFDRSNPYIASSFIRSPYRSLDKTIYQKYSLENWLKTIFLQQQSMNNKFLNK